MGVGRRGWRERRWRWGEMEGKEESEGRRIGGKERRGKRWRWGEEGKEEVRREGERDGGKERKGKRWRWGEVMEVAWREGEGSTTLTHLRTGQAGVTITITPYVVRPCRCWVPWVLRCSPHAFSFSGTEIFRSYQFSYLYFHRIILSFSFLFSFVQWIFLLLLFLRYILLYYTTY